MVAFDRRGPSGNIYFIMAAASGELKRYGMSEASEEMICRVKACHSYDDALRVIGEYVDLEEV